MQIELIALARLKDRLPSLAEVASAVTELPRPGPTAVEAPPKEAAFEDGGTEPEPAEAGDAASGEAGEEEPEDEANGAIRATETGEAP